MQIQMFGYIGAAIIALILIGFVIEISVLSALSIFYKRHIDEIKGIIVEACKEGGFVANKQAERDR